MLFGSFAAIIINSSLSVAQHTYRRRLGNTPIGYELTPRRGSYQHYGLSKVYTNDIQNPTGIDLVDEETAKYRDNYCKVFFNCGLIGMLNSPFMQPDDIPIFPSSLFFNAECTNTPGLASSRLGRTKTSLPSKPTSPETRNENTGSFIPVNDALSSNS